jgi:hypothetical protein
MLMLLLVMLMLLVVMLMLLVVILMLMVVILTDQEQGTGKDKKKGQMMGKVREGGLDSLMGGMKGRT